MKLLKFDTINPHIYLTKKIQENKKKLKSAGRQIFLEWIISTRGNFSDFYSYNLKKLGWESEEFFTNNEYVDKVAEDLYGSGKKLIYFKNSLKNKIRPINDRDKLKVIYDYTSKFNPDVILVREQSGIPSSFWTNFKKKTLLVSRLAAPIPRYWYPSDWDLILSSTQVFRDFFELNGVRSFINPNGFDLRILDEISPGEKIYDVTFAGGLGNRYWIKRTRCFEFIADKVNFKWWGYNSNSISKDSPLNKAWQGLTSGLEMLQIYRNSKIVLNDYGEIAGGLGVNQRLFEVLGVGSFLLTRASDNLKRDYPENLFKTFANENECLEKINYYLQHEMEREEIADAGKKYILENYNYEKLMKDLDKVLMQSYNNKFKTNGREH